MERGTGDTPSDDGIRKDFSKKTRQGSKSKGSEAWEY